MINVFINKAFSTETITKSVWNSGRQRQRERKGQKERGRDEVEWSAGEQVSGHSLRCPIGQLMKPINNAVDR